MQHNTSQSPSDHSGQVKTLSHDEVKMTGLAIVIFSVIIVFVIGGFYLAASIESGPEVTQEKIQEEISLVGSDVQGVSNQQQNQTIPLTAIINPTLSPRPSLSPTLLPISTPVQIATSSPSILPTP